MESKRLNHYYRCPKRLRDRDACPQPRNWRADRAEPKVWDLVSGLMTDPEQLRADLERMIELQRDSLRGDPSRETKAWLEKLAATGRMAEKELDKALAELDETRKTAERELSAQRGHQERIGELERDKDAILDSYAGMAPEALESLTLEERHRVYKMLWIRAVAHVDGTLEISGALASAVGVTNLATVPSWALSTASATRGR
jgi:hypothetical protein